jgi:predicted ribosomally synthesized peptide with nif11-like leader
MSQQALDGFRAELTNDQALRQEMKRALERDNGRRAPIEEVVAFAHSRGYEINADDLRQTLELSDDQLDAVAGGAGNFKVEIEGVQGGSKRDGHKDWIEVLSYSF